MDAVIASVQKLELKPGDIFVLNIKGHPNQQDLLNAERKLRRLLPHEVKFIVLGDAVEVGFIRFGSPDVEKVADSVMEA